MTNPTPSLFDDRPAPHNGTDTSKAAARAVRPKAPNLRAAVFERIRATGKHGITCDQLAREIGRPASSISARLNELAERGFITDSGMRRPTQYGRPARVYVAGGAASGMSPA